MAPSLPMPCRTACSPRPGPRPPGWHSHLTIVPAAVAAAATRAPARWHWEEEEGRAGSGECGARRELQAERRCRRLRGLRAEGGRSRGTPRAGPSAAGPRPRPRPDPGARALQAQGLRREGRVSGAWQSQPAREGASPRCLHERRVRGERCAKVSFPYCAVGFPRKGLDSDV